MLLAIDTSTRWASVALYGQHELIGEQTWRADNSHSVQVLTHIGAMMAAAQLTPDQLTGVVVALGPGAFSGLRVGLATAKALAVTLGIPIVGIPTLEALAYQHGSLTMPVRPLLDAGRGQFATCLYAIVRNRWVQMEDPRLASVEDLCLGTQRRTLFCGEIPPDAAAEIRQRLDGMVIIAPPAAAVRRAGYLAELGWHRLRTGQTDDPATLQAIYLHRPPVGTQSDAA